MLVLSGMLCVLNATGLLLDINAPHAKDRFQARTLNSTKQQICRCMSHCLL